MNRSSHWIAAVLLLGVLGVAFLLYRVVTRRGARTGAPVTAADRDEDPPRRATESESARARQVREKLRELVGAAETPRFLTGTVRSTRGPALAEAEVRVELADGTVRTVRTDVEGEYTLANIPGRAKRMEVSATGFATRIFSPLVLPGALRVRWDVELEPVEGVHGRVVVGNEPVPGALVTLVGPGVKSEPTRTDSHGRFALAWPTGARGVQVLAQHAAHGKNQVTVSRPGEVTIHLPGGGWVSGRVEDDRGSPVTRYRLTATVPAGGSGRRMEELTISVNDPQGAFRMGPLAAGPHEMVALAEGYQPGRGRAVRVEPGREVSGVVVVLQASGEIYGRVTDARTGSPIAGARVAPQNWSSPSWRGEAGTVTDAAGQFVLKSVPGGRTSLNVSAPGYNPLLAGGAVAPSGMRVRRDFALTPVAEGEKPRGQLSGIGAVMQTTPRGVEIRQLVAGGPAETALREGDVVVMVGDEDVRSAGIGRVAEAIRGEEGTDVVLWVQRGEGPPQRVVLRRRIVNFPPPRR